MDESSAEHGLRRTLGFWALLAYGVGDILGAGIYALVGKVAGVSGGMAWLAFAVALSVAAITALSYAELGGRYPLSGGEAYYTQKAFRRSAPALFVGWLVLCSGVVSLATATRAFSGYMTHFTPAVPQWITIVGFAALLAAIALRGIRESSAANIVCTIVESSGLLIVIGVGLLYVLGDGAPPAQNGPPPSAGWSGVVQGAALAFVAFIGFEDMVNVAEEARNPQRDLPAAILAALLIAGSVYIVIAWIVTAVVPLADLAASKAPLTTVVDRAAPRFPAGAFTLIALFAVANTGLLNLVMASRLLYGMARQGLVPGWLGRVHPTRRTPHWAILLLFAVVSTLALSGDLEWLAGSTSIMILAVFLSVNLSLMVIKRYVEPHHTGFRVPFIVPAVGAVTVAALAPFAPLNSLAMAGALVAIGLAIVGLHAAQLARERRRRQDKKL